MLRLLVLILLLANGVYYAWSQGLMRAYGMGPVLQSEPQRLAQQIRPEAVRLLSSTDAKAVDAQVQADLAPKECLQAGLFDAAQSQNLRAYLEQHLPSGAWQLDATMQPARWIVYMGKYPTAEALAKKRAELANLNLKFEVLNNPALDFGISLGGFDTQEAANADLARLTLRGIRTARVVQERAEAQVWQLKLPEVPEAWKPKLEALKPSLAGKNLRKCG
jgi:hypothetical protein